MKIEDKQKRSQEMRDDWNLRIQTDYRFWMSDGVLSDEVMWETGKRDLESLFGTDILESADARTWKVLDLGCGVGRLLRTAATKFRGVLGVDISETAIGRAKEFLADIKNVELSRIEGVGLDGVASGSINVVYSFAVLGHMPASVFVSYLLEINRVLLEGGHAFLQIYLGEEQENVIQDTLAVRSYQEQQLRQALASSGFEVLSLEELVMPFDARDVEKGIFPFVLRMSKTRLATFTAEEIVASLMTQPEESADEEWPGSRLEYQMAVTRVHQLIEEGKLEEAKVMLEFAVSRYQDAEEEAHKVLRELGSK